MREQRRTCAGSERASAILAVPTMIVGLYGMNFDHVRTPLAVRLSGVMLGVLLSPSLSYRLFRRYGWL